MLGEIPKRGNLSQDRDRCAALPVWFAQDVLHGAWAIIDFYFYSEASAGKLKRIRNNRNARCAEMSAASESMAALASVKMTRPLMVSSYSHKSTAC